jgi:hypothetical protein
MSPLNHAETRIVNKVLSCNQSSRHMTYLMSVFDLHQTTYHIKKGVQITAMFNLGTSTLLCSYFLADGLMCQRKGCVAHFVQRGCTR